MHLSIKKEKKLKVGQKGLEKGMKMMMLRTVFNLPATLFFATSLLLLAVEFNLSISIPSLSFPAPRPSSLILWILDLQAANVSFLMNANCIQLLFFF